MLLVDVRSGPFHFKGIPQIFLHFAKEDGAESLPEEVIRKESDPAPELVIAGSAFCEKDMNMGVPLKTAAKSMEDADKARSKLFRAVDFAKHLENNFLNGMEKEIEEIPVLKKIVPDFLGDGKNQVSVFAVEKFKRNRSRTLNGIEITAGRTKTAAAMKRNDLNIATGFAFINCAAIIGITAMDHAVDIFNNCGSWFEQDHNLLVMFNKNLL